MIGFFSFCSVCEIIVFIVLHSSIRAFKSKEIFFKLVNFSYLSFAVHIVALWRSGSDGVQQSNECWFKSYVRCNLQGMLLQVSQGR